MGLLMGHEPEGRPAWLGAPRHHVVPPGTGTFGMILFLLALGMLFGASVVGYVIIRLTSPQAPPWGAIEVPWGLWLSTAVLVVSSVTMHLALANVQRERQSLFRRAMVATLVLGVAFLLVQAPALSSLLGQHWTAQADEQGYAFYGLIFFFICVHGAHVLGGIVPMAVVTWQAMRGRYDHEHYGPVKHLAMYWHFLDGAWIALFGAFVVLG